MKTGDNFINNKIETIIAQVRNFSPEKPINDAIVYFWESHTDKNNDPRRLQATIDLIYKEFDMMKCEKYEVRTGYLSRYNFLQKPIEYCSDYEIEYAIIQGKQQEQDWVDRCQPELPHFQLMDWEQCISENDFLDGCKELISEKVKNNSDFRKAFENSINYFAEKHGTNIDNGRLYILEEISWMLTLPLLHPENPIYLVHVDEANEAVDAMFHHFPNLKKAVRWISPRFITATFENFCDFLLDYRNGKHAGYSCAAKNKKKHPLVNTQIKNRALPSPFTDANIEMQVLRSIISKFPGHVYWLNRDNIYLGCNDMQAKKLNLKFREDIVGKNNFDFHSKKEAEEINRINTIVMKNAVPYEGEEISSTKSGGLRYYISQKIPLYSNKGEAIGLLGISIDITDRKNAEQLAVKNETQKLKIKVQEEFHKFTSQMAHDIRSPLAALGMIAEACNKFPEKEHIALRSIVGTIRDIADNLLHKYKEHETECNSLEKNVNQKMLVSLALSEIISQKRYQYKDINVKFDYHFDQSSNFAFIKCNYLRFCRMISNLINNSVEALPDNEGVVYTKLFVENNNIKISIKDNGKGMPNDLINKILDNIPIESTKEGGYGMGLRHTVNTLRLFDGSIEIESKDNIGTEIMLTFPITQSPEWISTELNLQKKSIVVVLDDDTSVHHIWNKELEKYSDDLEMKYFEYGEDAIKFINSSKRKDKIFLLTDFELRNQDLNGIDVINRTNTQNRSVIVTSISNDNNILDFSNKTGVKILPKSLINCVSTSIIKDRDLPSVDMIILDDYEPFVELLADFFETKGKRVDTYYNSTSLLSSIVNYNKDIKIVMDNELKEKMTGIELAKKLKDIGFSELYLLSGKQFDQNEIPDYLTTILKDDYNYLEKLYTTIF